MDQLGQVISLIQQQMLLLQEQQKESNERFLKILEKLEANTETKPIILMDKHTIFDSLYRRIEKFTFDAENGKTFDVWFKRFKDVFDNDCGELEEKEKTRLLVSRLDEDCHQLFCGSISPKLPSDLTWDEAITTLERLFGSAKTLFRRRFECFKMQYEHQDFNMYETLVRTRCTDAKLDSIDFDGLQCLVYVAGFQGAEFADYRTRLLRKLDQTEKLSIKDLTAECQLIKSYKEDSKMLENATLQYSTVNYVAKNKTSFKQQRRTKDEGNHNPQIPKRYKRFKRKDRKTKSYQMKSIIAALQKDVQPHLEVTINDQPFSLLLDTGAMITIISRSNWKRLGKPRLRNSDAVINAANGTRILIDGCFPASFMLRNSDGHQYSGEGPCYVSENLNVFGWEWIQKVPDLLESLQKYVNSATILQDPAAACREEIVNKLKTNFADVFETGLGRCTKVKAKLQLKPDAHPVFIKKRPVPHAYVANLDAEIDRLLKEGVLFPVDYSAWAAPIVVVKKRNGSLRLCADFSTGLNEALMLHQHPLPTPDDIFLKLNGGTTFTQIDFADAYLQIELDDTAKELLTINTHRGLLRFNRLPFGVKSAPGIFQQIMDSMICGLNGCAAYLDDVIVTGRTIEEHVANLEALFKRISDYGFRVRIEKCNFLMPQLRYLGTIITAAGRRPDPSKIEAIRKMPHPKDIRQLRSFLGMLNYYGHFVKEIHQLRAPMDALLKKDVPFKWSDECEKAFQKAKDVLTSDLLLTHFDPSKKIVIAADASEQGIGAVISHRFPDGTEKAIQHACRTLTAAERNYGQVEKEALAITSAVRKFHRYVYGRHFELLTDHKPLLAIFGSKKGVPVYTANRLQRWALLLKNYNFTINYTSTSNFGQADALSRLIAEQPVPEEDTIIATIEMDAATIFINAVTKVPVNAKRIAEETAADPVLKKILESVTTGLWRKRDEYITGRYISLRGSLSLQEGCLLVGDRIVIPERLRAAVLEQLHEGHPGMTRMKMLAREYVFWPNINKDIENCVRKCDRCQKLAKNPVKATLCSWPTEEEPWRRIHADFAGPVDGKMYLVVVDAYSKWPEIVDIPVATTSATIKELRRLFAQFGNPETLVTDNGSPFTSKEFEDFCSENGIRHLRSPPFHPLSNGQAERFVDTFKRTLQKLKNDTSKHEALQSFLLTYRRTPCPSSPKGKSPAEAFLGRTIRTNLNLLKPSDITSERNKNKQMEDQYNRHWGARPKEFNIGDLVWTSDYRGRKSQQTPACVLRRHGHRIYDVEADGQVWKRHANQLRPRHPDITTTEPDLSDLPLLPCPEHPRDRPSWSNFISDTTACQSSPIPTDALPDTPREKQRQSSPRDRRPPERLQIDPSKKSYT
ncbi:unnamed protein product [Nippostrongylus brasiliensis]|uniref:RNA-directed DNA polymerase n=1 Tax=Nippostrongylus brasiliensis TaxID=27835 RepID=A0A0N4XIW5_NIPBR|nr:unnamed protein product [Nippostrongylus brasiliensis]